MADFHPLSDHEQLALRRYEAAARSRRRFKLLRLAGRSTIRLVDAYSGGLDPTRPIDAEGLALLTARVARAYERLAGLNAAIAFAHRTALRTLRATGIEVDP